MQRAAVLFLIIVFLSSCYQTKIVAPPGHTVTLASAHEKLPHEHKEKNWFILFGAIRLNNNTTAPAIKRNNFSKIRVRDKFTFGDYLLAILLNVFIPTTVVTKTVIIEGERAGEKLNKESRWE